MRCILYCLEVIVFMDKPSLSLFTCEIMKCSNTFVRLVYTNNNNYTKSIVVTKFIKKTPVEIG